MNVPLATPALSSDTLLARAAAHQQAGRWVEAEAALHVLLAQSPGHPQALHRLGTLLLLQTRNADAVAVLQVALTLAPGQAGLHVDLAQALRGVGEGAEAATHFDRACALAPDNRAFALVALLHRGTWLEEMGRSEDALACFERATVEHPESADAWATLGTVLAHLKPPEQAAPALQRALQLDPSRAAVIERYALVLQDMRRHEDAVLVFERLFQLEPQRPLAAGRLMHSKMLIADWTSLDRLQRHIETGIAQGRLMSEPFGLQACCDSPALLHKAACDHGARFFPDRSSTLPPVQVGRSGKIRVGYVAGEFRNQATSVLLTEVLELHDRERFEIVAFDNGWDDGSRLRRRIEAAVDIVPIRGLSNADAAQRIRERGIDILVNLNGHFGLARTQLFAMRPAPVQVNYLGFPGTLGVPHTDYIVADRVVIPQADRVHYAEQVVTLPHCYQPNDRQREIAAEPSRRAQVGLPQDAFVFCCMNNVYKIVPAQFDVWMRLLKQVPGSVLMLYSNLPEAQANLRHEAQARGVDGARLVFGGPLDVAAHLARLRLADLFLDTLPYNAHTTGSDALWAGLPVLTCLGGAFPGRVGASLLQAVGLPELVTHSMAQYEALALRLATEPGLLSGIRTRLAASLRGSKLFDTPAYTCHLEAAYTQMVQRARSGLAAASFAVDALA